MLLTICLQIAERGTGCFSLTSYSGCKSSQLPGPLCLWQHQLSNFRPTSLIPHIVHTIICLSLDISQRRPSRALSTSYHLGLAALMHNVLRCSFINSYCHSLSLSCHFWDSLMGHPSYWLFTASQIFQAAFLVPGTLFQPWQSIFSRLTLTTKLFATITRMTLPI